MINCKFLCGDIVCYHAMRNRLYHRKRAQQSFAEKRRLGASLDNLDAVMQETVEGTSKSLGSPGTWVRQLFSFTFDVKLNPMIYIWPILFCYPMENHGNTLRLAAYQTLSQLIFSLVV